jgi:hypothetical protein
VFCLFAAIARPHRGLPEQMPVRAGNWVVRVDQEERRTQPRGTVALTDRVPNGERVSVTCRSSTVSISFAGYRFPPDVILLAVRWYLRYGLSYRDVEELLAERGIEVDHVTIYRWV